MADREPPELSRAVSDWTAARTNAELDRARAALRGALMRDQAVLGGLAERLGGHVSAVFAEDAAAAMADLERALR